MPSHEGDWVLPSSTMVWAILWYSPARLEVAVLTWLLTGVQDVRASVNNSKYTKSYLCK